MNRSLLSATAILLGLTGWMASGPSASQPHPAQEKKEPAEQPLMKVLTQYSQAKPIAQEITVQGQVEPRRVVTLRAETAGRVIALPKKKGERVLKGEILIQLSPQDRLARQEEAKAMIRQQKHDFKAAYALAKKKLLPESQLKAEEAKMAAAQARLKQIQWEIDNLAIRAPFSGVLNHREVELGSYLQSGDDVITLMDDHTLLLTAQVPQRAALQLKLKQKVTATLIHGEKLQGAISYISAAADPETRSFRIEVQVKNPEHRPFSGLSATLQFPFQVQKAHPVTPSILGLDSAGQIIIKSVDSEARVVTHPVKIVRSEPKRLWVAGLPEQLNLIIQGHAFVKAGFKVIAVGSEN
ncbi:efflux RND transporter periplasmic adaptor subunit [Magnetococcales bacterium HHB-1]